MANILYQKIVSDIASFIEKIVLFGLFLAILPLRGKIIHIGVAHQNDFVVSEFLDIKFVFNPGSDRGNDGANFFVRQNFVDTFD